MKQQVLKKLKVPDVIRICIAILTSTISVEAQFDKNCDTLTGEEYNLINQYFDSPRINNSPAPVFFKTYVNPAWSNYFDSQGLKKITDKVGIPTTITDEKLKSILTKDVRSKISSALSDGCPVIMKKKYLNKNIKLLKSYKGGKKLKKGVLHIIKPIIVDDIAIFSKIGNDEIPIFIMQRNNDQWEIIYTFYDKLILE